MLMYDHYFRCLDRSPIPDHLCKDSAISHPRFSRRRFLKVFTIYGHDRHLGQWTATILALFHSPAPGRLQMKFEQHWPRGSRGGRLEFWTFFPYKCIGKQTRLCRKKVKCQCMTIILATLVDLPFTMIYAKIQAQGILGFGKEDF